MNVTIDPGCNAEVRDNAARWIAEAASWSAEQYNKVDLEAGTTWSIVADGLSSWVTTQVQHRPIPVGMNEINEVRWTEAIKKREWFTSQFYDVDNETGIKTAAVAVMSHCKYALAKDINDEEYRQDWHTRNSPMEEKLLFCQQVYPELVTSWTDRSGWLDEFRKNIKPTHWTFPTINKKLCRYGRWGEGAVFPPGSDRQ